MLRTAFSAYGGPLESSFETVFAALHLPWTPAMPSRTIAIVLAATFGIFGLHLWYLGDRRRAMKYLKYCWTMFPVVLGIRDAVRLVLMDQAEFERQHRGRSSLDFDRLVTSPSAVMKVQARDTATATFTAALDALVIQLRERPVDPGRHSRRQPVARHVWAKSDIDLLLVTADDRLDGPSDIALYADGVNVHALLMQRAEFRKLAEGAAHQSFMHSFLAKSRLLFTHDDTIAELCARLQKIGERDTHLALLRRGRARWRRSTRRTSSSIPAAISTTPRSGFCTRRRRSRRSRSSTPASSWIARSSSRR